MAWLAHISDWQAETADPGEFLDSLRFEIGAKEVYVFTPKGRVIGLPAGATPVDFAYAVHTEVGHRTMGAKVNGRLVPLESELSSGDVVEVFTSKNPDSGPSKDWLNVRQEPARPQQDPAVVHQGAPRRGDRAGPRRHRPRDAQAEPAAAEADEPGVVRRGRRAAALRRRLVAVRRGRRGPRVDPVGAREGRRARPRRRRGRRARPARSRCARARCRGTRDSGVLVRGAPDILVKLARCCTPVPGDEIVGFITRGAGRLGAPGELPQRAVAAAASPSA